MEVKNVETDIYRKITKHQATCNKNQAENFKRFKFIKASSTHKHQQSYRWDQMH